MGLVKRLTLSLKVLISQFGNSQLNTSYESKGINILVGT